MRAPPGSARCSALGGWNSAGSFPAGAPSGGAGGVLQSAGRTQVLLPHSRARVSLLLQGDGVCSWKEKLLPSDAISTAGLGGNVELFLLANDILRISLLSSYSWFRHLEAREQVCKETSQPGFSY